MKNTTYQNWIFLAEGDLKIAKDELNTSNPVTNAICFHAQQCVEKYLKAYLICFKKPFGKTHDISFLVELCSEVDKDFLNLYNLNSNKLTRYAVEIRYPDEFYFPTVEEAKEAIKICEKVKEFIINQFHKKGIQF